MPARIGAYQRSRMSFAAIVSLACALSTARAQVIGDPSQHPFATGAVMIGAMGFARPPITNTVIGAYGYAPLDRLLLGGQGGGTIAEHGRSDVSYGMATLGYAQASGERWQVYPFVGFGGGAMRARPGKSSTGLVFGAGFGADAIAGADDRGFVLGIRAGYITRGLADDGSVAYLTVAFGAGGRARRESVVALHTK